MKQIEETYDVVVCGGGLAGLSAAISAARHGARACLIQDRPVFGGNSSSEIRVTPCGAASFHAYSRETGLVSEWMIEERANNHEPIIENAWTNSIFDLVLYDSVVSTPGLTFHLNTSVVQVIKSDDRTIESIICRIANAEIELRVQGRIFIDCTGDGVVAVLAGCEWRMGCEARSEFNEPHAPLVSSADTMGSSLMFKMRNMGHPVPFKAPEWAMKYDNEDFFYKEGRVLYQVDCGYWWIELGMPWNTIYDNEIIRHELTRHLLGIVDWMKNKDPRTREKASNFGLDWIGQVPGKRESRRIMGRYFMTEHDLLKNTVFEDEIAYGGWYIDLHTPGGLLAGSSEPIIAENWTPDSEYAVKSYVGPYGIPLRTLIARDVDNLMMAGRDISVTHAALGSARVQLTTGLMGQGAGTAAAIALQKGLPVAEVPEKAIFEVKQALLRDGCFLPNTKNEDPLDLARFALAFASSEALLHSALPDSSSPSENLLEWGEPPDRRSAPNPLKTRQGQWIAVGEDRLDSLAVCLTNRTTETQTVEARLLPVDSIWDYRSEPYPILRKTILRVQPKERQWVVWELGLSKEDGLIRGSYLRLDLLANPQVEWEVAGGIEPGHVAAVEISPGHMRRFRTGATLGFQVKPPQRCYGPLNVLNGVTRPQQYTNQWRSDPEQQLPQWLELRWDVPQMVGEVDLTFLGGLLKDFYYYPPLFKDPLTVRDYSISAFVDETWKEVVVVTGNYQRLRKHILPAQVQTKCLRITIHATNGDPSAGLFEVRVYA